MAKRLQPCPFRPEELELTDGHCAACGHPVVDLAAASEAEAGAWLAQRQSGCVRVARGPGGRLLFHQKALTGALTVAAALALPAAPRLAATLPAGIVRGAAIELPELDAVSPNDPLAFPRLHSGAPLDGHPLTDEEVERMLLTIGGYLAE